MLTAVTFASAMTAWLGSVTRPLIEPVVDCPRTAAAQARKRNNPTVGACRIVGTSGTLILLTTSRFCQRAEDTHPKDAVGLARVRKIFLRSGQKIGDSRSIQLALTLQLVQLSARFVHQPKGRRLAKFQRGESPHARHGAT